MGMEAGVEGDSCYDVPRFHPPEDFTMWSEDPGAQVEGNVSFYQGLLDELSGRITLMLDAMTGPTLTL